MPLLDLKMYNVFYRMANQVVSAEQIAFFFVFAQWLQKVFFDVEKNKCIFYT